jgi:hypothetical protein
MRGWEQTGKPCMSSVAVVEREAQARKELPYRIKIAGSGSDAKQHGRGEGVEGETGTRSSRQDEVVGILARAGGVLIPTPRAHGQRRLL